MSHTQYFQPSPATDRNTTQRIGNAYQAAAIPAPTTYVPALKRYMAEQPDAQQVAATLAHEAYSADPDTVPADWWATARQQMIDAQASDALRAALVQSLATEERASGARQIARALADLKPWAERQCKALKTAAGKLPAGPAALDPEAVLAADAGAALTTTRQALAALALVASVPDTATRHVGTLGYYAHVMSLVDPGKPTEEVVNGLGTALNTSKLDNTLAIRKLAQDMKTSPDLALVDVARGAYPDLTLDPAATPADITDRATRARTAFTRRTASENEQSKLIAMR